MPRKGVLKVLMKTVLTLLVAAAMSLSFVPASLAGREIVVSAASSLTDAFKRIGGEFESANPGVKVTFNFAASGALLQQVLQGAPVDVFASADVETMDKARRKGAVDAATITDFAGNKLVLVAPTGLRIKGMQDLGGAAVKRIALGKPETVPAGRYAKEALEANGTWAALEPKFIYAESVRQALYYVVRGEVDAGFVYATDAAIPAGRLNVVSEVGGHKPIIYPIAAVASGKEPALARRFIGYVVSDKGQAVLASYGFGRP